MPRKLSNSHKKKISEGLKRYHKSCKSKKSFNQEQFNKERKKLKEMIKKK